MTPEQQAAEMLADHGIWDAYGGDRVRCYCNRGEHVVVWMNRVAHAEHQTAALAAAGVLRDPDTHEAVPHCPTCTCGCTCGYGGLHEPENPRCNLTAAIDGAAHTTGHGRDEVTG